MWLEEGQRIGEHVLPLARNFNDVDVETGSNFSVSVHGNYKHLLMSLVASIHLLHCYETRSEIIYSTIVSLSKNFDLQDESCVEMNTSSSYDAETNRSEIARRYGTGREAITNKYAAMREQNKKKQEVTENMVSAKVSLLEPENFGSESSSSSSGLASTWRNMKLGLQSFKDNATTKNYLPLRQITEETSNPKMPSSLDEIFQRLRNRSVEHQRYIGDDNYEGDIPR